MNGSKNDENNIFLAEWEPIRKKGLMAFAGPHLLKFFILIVASLGILFLIFRPSNIEKLDYVIVVILVNFMIVTDGKVIEWFKKEKKYKDILDLYETINKCPICSRKISPEDKNCPTCGVMLGI